tara:strand:- start:3554 stop:5662 length:2109 start_codon:yes stop_codon:yes gene_type:complete
MATKQVNIDIIAKDKTRQAMKSATMGVERLKNSVFNLRNALVGLGAGLVAKSFIDTGREVERLRVRFKFLFDEAGEGEKAFKGLIKFASQVPFSLEEIQRGSANLAVVSKDADELNKLLKITGDIASASGLDFQTTAEQIQRTFAGGINSADLFRERGVRALLGFEAGVAISAEQSRDHILKAFEEGSLSVVGASSVMAKTFDGTLSMIGDKFNLFKMAVMDSAPFDFLKSGAMFIEKELEKNFGGIEKAGKRLGVAIVGALKDVLRFGAKTIDFLMPLFKFVKNSVINLIEFAQGVPQPFASVGIIGFLMLGTKGKLLVAFIGGIIDEIRETIGFLIQGLATAQEKLNSFTFGRSQERIDAVTQSIKEMRDIAERLKTPISEVDEKFGEIDKKNTFEKLKANSDVAFESSTKYADSLEKIFKKMEKISEANKKAQLTTPNLLEGLSGQEMNMRGQDILAPGMSGSELLDARPNELVALQSMADMEVEIAKATADKRLEIAKETANKEKQLRQKFIDEQLAVLQSGKFQELKLVGLSEQQKEDLIVTSGRTLLNQIAQQNKTAFQLNKAISMAEAVQNTARGVTKALGVGNIPMAILIGALGAVQIATIAKTKYQGRRLGGRMNKGQPYMVGEAGEELVVPDSPSTVIPNNKLNSVGQPLTVNFNINTVDARGFNELLVNSRGTIVSLINQAVNEKGKMAIV